MKSLVVSIIILFTTPAFATNTLYIGYGTDFARNANLKQVTDFNEQAMSLGVRHYTETNTFYQLKLLSYNGGQSGNYIGASIGKQLFINTPKTIFVNAAIGWGYLDNPDGNLPRGKLSHHQQGEILLGAGYRVNNTTSIHLDWDHLSNCSKVCNRGENYSPNHGRDFLMLGTSISF